MSGIFKGDSIYKSGGGGGGYKDGGELVDGDFIKVENNSFSTYENISRSDVNFYVELNDGDVLNSVINFTTQVNANVYFYVVKNGFYYLLSYAGTNTVNAGDEYNINANGNVYEVEQVTPPVNSNPKILINGGLYSVGKIGNLWWTLEDYIDGSNGVYTDFNNVAGLLPDGWRIPNNGDFSYLKNYCDEVYHNFVSSLRSPSWNASYNNASGFSAIPNGLWEVSDNKAVQVGTYAYYWAGLRPDIPGARYGYTMHDSVFTSTGSYKPTAKRMSLRFCKDA